MGETLPFLIRGASNRLKLPQPQDSIVPVFKVSKLTIDIAKHYRSLIKPPHAGQHQGHFMERDRVHIEHVNPHEAGMPISGQILKRGQIGIAPGGRTNHEVVFPRQEQIVI